MMLLGLGIAGVSEIVGAYGGRKCSEDFADCDADGFGRARGGLAQQVLELGEDLSIGLGSGEYFGRRAWPLLRRAASAVLRRVRGRSMLVAFGA